MRENIGIYRGKRIDTGAWKEGYLLGVQDRLTGKDLFFIVDEVGEYHRVDPETLGEYTGFTDKNGEKIFEGDIVKIYDSYDLAHDDVADYQISKVFYFDSAICVEHYCSDYDFTVIGWIEDVEYEVISNIYEGDCTT